ncbi:MAG TPA: hypothetical protein VJ455_08520, partial [Ignavibacteria bacterium]|nr:hypothetical protein [Ignavibacteria bacterium]
VLYIVIGIYSTQSLRYTSDFIIVIFIPLVISINYFLKNIKIKIKFQNIQTVKTAVVVVLIFLTINTYNNDIYRFLNVPFRETGFGISQKYFPVCLFDFMKINKICDIGIKTFNSMRVGGYFLWSFEGKKNFADNRCLNGRIIKEYLDISLCRDNFNFKLKEYDIDYIIINIPDINTIPFEMQFNLPAYLAKNPEWKLIYWDDKSFLYVRNETKFYDLISKYEYKYLTPSNCLFHKNIIVSALKTDSKKVMNEINRRLSEDKNGVIINDIVNYLNYHRLAAVYMNNN